MTREGLCSRFPELTLDLFDDNAIIVYDLGKEIAHTCPDAFILVISNPVNSVVPIMAEVLKSASVFNPKRLFGITTLDVVRASTFVAEVTGLCPKEVVVPVVGGHSNNTIVPLLSQTKPKIKLDDQMVRALTTRIQCAGDEIIQAKAGLGSATLCMAYAAYRSTTLAMDLISRFAESVIQASMGAKGIVEPSFVYLPGLADGDVVQTSVQGLDFFSTNLELGVEPTEIMADDRLTVYNVSIRSGRSALMNKIC